MKLTTYRCNLCGVIRKQDEMEPISDDIHICNYCSSRPVPLEAFLRA